MENTLNSKLTLAHVQAIFEVKQTQASFYLSSLKKKVGRKTVFVHEFIKEHNLNENILSKIS